MLCFDRRDWTPKPRSAILKAKTEEHLQISRFKISSVKNYRSGVEPSFRFFVRQSGCHQNLKQPITQPHCNHNCSTK